MATIKKQGRGYKITVSNGYDIKGRHLREHMTWTPDPGMTERQIEKELNRQAVLFEEQVKNNGTHDSNIRFAEFAEIFLRDYARPHLKIQTVYGYEEHLKKINLAIGHIKLKDLKPTHLAAFYANLRENGVRDKVLATATFDLAAWLKKKTLSMAAFSRDNDISLWAVKHTRDRQPIAKESAEKIASAIGKDVKALYKLERDMTPLSEGSIRTYHHTISTILTRAVKWRYLNMNVADLVDLPKYTAPEANYLDEDGVNELLDALEHEPIRWRTLVMFDLMGGWRRGEMAGLEWQDIDLDRGMIAIRRAYYYVPKVGTYVDTPKSEKSVRVLRLSKAGILLLTEYKAWQDQQRELLGDAWEDSGRVFTTETGGPIFPSSITAWFRAFRKRAMLPPCHLHSLRHTCASLLIADGAPIVVVAKQLGHAQTSTTMNIYTHVIEAAEARAAETFDRFLENRHQIDTKTEKSRFAV